MRFNDRRHKLMYVAVPMFAAPVNVEPYKLLLFNAEWRRGRARCVVWGHWNENSRGPKRHAIMAFPAQRFYGDDPRPDFAVESPAADAVLLIACDTRMNKQEFIFWAGAVLGESIVDPQSYRPTTIDLSEWRGA